MVQASRTKARTVLDCKQKMMGSFRVVDSRAKGKDEAKKEGKG